MRSGRRTARPEPRAGAAGGARRAAAVESSADRPPSPAAGRASFARPPSNVAPSPLPAPAEQRSVAILKSGVVDGMAYTLYADGSIEAKLPHGTVRFGSIAELRAHIESNS